MTSAMEELRNYGDLEENSRFSYVLLHPLGADTNLLLKLDMVPEDCRSCDLYWVYENHLMFVSILADMDQPPRVTAHRKPGVEHGISFFVIVSASWLEHHEVEQTLEHLSRWISRNSGYLKTLGANPVAIANYDVETTK